MTRSASSTTQKAVAVFCALLLPVTVGFGQAPPPGAPQDQGQPAPLLSPQQLDNLVAPVALYPDPLLGQVLAASTYPLETVEAQQWLKQQGNLRGAQLVDAAKRMNWDASVQALVAFPDALSLLANDVGWTTDLGNAYLAQQADVMSAVQRMRSRARANGKLQSTPQEVVTTDTQDGQSAIEIQPTNPEVIYVPVYQPEYIWGTPEWGVYPDLWYPPYFSYGFGFGWGPGVYIGSFFPGWGGWGGWGWGCGWFGGRGLFVNTAFFSHYGFRGGFGGRFDGGRFGAGRAAWAHDPGHRGSVPYPNRAVATRFNSTRFNGAGGNVNRSQFSGGGNRAGAGQFSGSRTNGVTPANRGANAGAQANTGGWRTFNGNNRPAASNGFAGANRGVGSNGGAGLAQSNRGASGAPANAGGWRSFNGNSRPASPNSGAAASPRYNSASSFRGASSGNRAYAPQSSAPRSQSFSAPRSFSAPSAPRQSFSAPHSQSFSAPRSFSGGGGGGSRSFSGGGGHSGGSGGGGHSGGGGGGGRHR